MASTSVSEPVAAKTPVSTSPKKTRKNPARRKAEKANANVEANKDADASNTSSTPTPAKLARQASAPTVLSNPNATKPPLQSRKSSNTAGIVKNGTATAQENNSNPKPQSKPNPTTALIANPSRPKPHRSATTSSSSLAFNAPAFVTGGLIGCAAGAAILMAVHVWYDFAGVKAAIDTARAARLCVDNFSEELIGSLRAGTYSTDEALDILRRTTLAYASTIPDGALAVERVFREIQLVRQSRGAEVDRVLAGAYDELRSAGDRGLSARETRDVVLRHLLRLSLFASRATQDVLTRNPRLKPYRDGAIKALKEPPKDKVPTSKVNLVVNHRQTAAA